jgi:hypothetical protein
MPALMKRCLKLAHPSLRSSTASRKQFGPDGENLHPTVQVAVWIAE